MVGFYYVVASLRSFLLGYFPFRRAVTNRYKGQQRDAEVGRNGTKSLDGPSWMTSSEQRAARAEELSWGAVDLEVDVTAEMPVSVGRWANWALRFGGTICGPGNRALETAVAAG